MPMFLFEGKCFGGALFRLARDGGTRRAASLFDMVKSHGGKCKTVYYGQHGETFAMATLPNTESARSVQQLLHSTWNMDVSIHPVMSPARFDHKFQNVLDTTGYLPLTNKVRERSFEVKVPVRRAVPSSLTQPSKWFA